MADAADTNGRDSNGRFAAGNPGGPGGSRRRSSELRRAVEEAISPEHIAAMTTLIEAEMKAGVLLGTEGCLPSMKGARVRIENGQFTVKDGPFAEAKELVGGFALLQAASKEDAIEATKRFLKVVGEGECEIRQLYEAPAAT